MPRGFSGQTVKRFFEKTGEAMQKAGEAHNKRPFENKPDGMMSYSQRPYTYGATNQGMSSRAEQGMPASTTQSMYANSAQGTHGASRGGSGVNIPTFPEPTNHKLPFSPEDADPFNDRHKTGVGNRSNIVVEQSVYEECMKKLEMVDDKAGEEIYKLCCTVEEMCKTIYIVPETIPRVMAITSRVKNSMPKFRELTEEVRLQVKKHVEEIGYIDQAPDGFKVIVSDEGVDYVLGSTKDAVGKQIQSMEDTAKSYAQAAESLLNQAQSLKRQEDMAKNRVDMLDARVKTLEQREAMERAAGLGNPLGGAVNPFRTIRN